MVATTTTRQEQAIPVAFEVDHDVLGKPAHWNVAGVVITQAQ